jgi:hypothetical protein
MKAHLSTNDEKRIRQVILQFPRGAAGPPKFRGLMLPPDTNPVLNFQTHCADFFSMDDDAGPFLMIRSDGHIEQFRDSSLVVAYTFCRFDAGGLFATFVGIDLPGEDTPWGGIVESKIPLDYEIEFAVDRLDKALRRDEIHMCFAGASSNRGKYVSISDGSSIAFTPPHCEFDRVFPVPPQLREVLTKEFMELQAYHAAIGSAKRSPRRCMDQFNTSFPPRMHPIIGYRFISVSGG